MKTKNNNVYQPDELDLLEYFGVFFRYKFLILIISASVSVCGLLFLFITGILPPEKSMLPDVFTPSALILVNERTVGDTLSSLLSGSTFSSSIGISAGITDRFSYGQLALKLLYSREVLDTITEEFKIHKKYGIKKHMKTLSRNMIKKNLRAVYDENTMTITISYKDYDPYFASSIVNRVIELLDKRFIEIGGYTNIHRKELLEVKIAEIEADIVILEANVQRFQKNMVCWISRVLLLSMLL